MERRYADQTDEVILQRLLGRVDESVDKRQGSVTYDMLAPSSIEFAQAYIALDDVIAFGIDVDEDSPEVFVDRKARWQGLTRKPSVRATGILTFSGDNGLTIPTGTQARTDDAEPLVFETLSDEIISSGSVSVNARAVSGGAASNVGAGEVTVVLGGLSGVVTVNNATDFTGGVDKESNADLLARYYDKVQRPATSGNVYQYEQWAKEVPGIGDAKAEAIWDGPGTVRVTVIDGNRQVPNTELVEAVEAYIEGIRPIGATVTYQAAAALEIDVNVDITLAPEADLAEVTAEFEERLSSYLKSLAFKENPTGTDWEVVRYSQIANLLLDTNGVIDYEGLTVNGGTANLQPALTQVAVVGEVVFT